MSSRVRAILVLASLALALSACDLQARILRYAISSQADYFKTRDTETPTLTKLSDRVYTYNWYFDRTLVVRTNDGLVVIDPFNRTMAENLRSALREAGITDPVHTLIYSHYHLDHVRGGGALQPQHVVAHAKSPTYWDDWDARDVLAPTRYVEGDQALVIGGVAIHMLYLGKAHSDTQYAFHIPGDRVVYAPDTVSVRVFLPGGGPDIYMPGFIRALKRIEAVDFDIFVASHFGWGSKADFSESVQMIEFVQALAERTVVELEQHEPVLLRKDSLGLLFDRMYEPLQARYGHWHGFESQAVNAITRHYTGAYLGF